LYFIFGILIDGFSELLTALFSTVLYSLGYSQPYCLTAEYLAISDCC